MLKTFDNFATTNKFRFKTGIGSIREQGVT